MTHTILNRSFMFFGWFLFCNCTVKEKLLEHTTFECYYRPYQWESYSAPSIESLKESNPIIIKNKSSKFRINALLKKLKPVKKQDIAHYEGVCCVLVIKIEGEAPVEVTFYQHKDHIRVDSALYDFSYELFSEVQNGILSEVLE